MAQLEITEPADGYWRVTFGNPPINLMNAQTAAELQELVGRIETAPDLRVVVFDSADPDYFLARYDFAGGGLSPAPGPTGLPQFLDLTVRLAAAPVVSIASIRGRTRGGGNEFALACDLRFASMERAIFGQPEVGIGLIPGGGGLERLIDAIGRARALEVILSADDVDAATAQQYGWVNRALPDALLDRHVDALAGRLARFDRDAIAAAKRMVNRRALPSNADLVESQDAALALAGGPAFRQRFPKVGALARSLGADFDLRLGEHLGSIR